MDNKRQNHTHKNTLEKRLSGSFEGVLLGIIFVFGALYLLWWNENNHVNEHLSLLKGQKTVIPIVSETVDPSHQEDLVYLAGDAKGNAPIVDPIFNISFDALKFTREVEVFQWQEIKKTSAVENWDGTTKTTTLYDYEKIWNDGLITSNSFSDQTHQNPTEVPYKTSTFTSPIIKIGAYELGSTMKDHIKNYKEHLLEERDYQSLPDALKQKFTLQNGYLYSGDPTNPSIGDMRIRYKVIAPGPYSVIGMQLNSTIDAYHFKTGKICLLDSGVLAPGKLFTEAPERNPLITWFLRLASFMLLWFGLKFIINPLVVMGRAISYLKWATQAGLNLVLIPVAMGLTLSTIALAWLPHQPLTAALIILVAAGFLYGGFYLIKKQPKKGKKAAKKG